MKHVHLIGIGGTGLSAIALVLLERGIQVSGSDRLFSPLAERLQNAGARIFIGHRPENIQGADLVVRSSAIPDGNPEVQAALATGIPVLKRVDFLAQLTAGKHIIAVAGTHGKTTTTAMIAWMLTKLGLDPSYVIGSFSTNLGANAHAGQGAYFVIEADEYDRMFLGLNPQIAVVTNIEHDHPDCFPTPEDYFQAFSEFVRRLETDGYLVICADDPVAVRLGQAASIDRNVLSYGVVNKQSLYQAEGLSSNQMGGYDFNVKFAGVDQETKFSRNYSVNQPYFLQVPGIHNVNNALAALVVADILELPWDKALAALSEFRGTDRRFQLRGVVAGVAVVDDYAHHPTEIRATLAAARTRYPSRIIWAVWQPHTYSRTRTLARSFSEAFSDQSGSLVDHVIVTAIYAARESAPQDGFSANEVVAMMKNPDVHYIPDMEDVIDYLLEHLRPGNVLLTLSAGDADQISSRVLHGLTVRSQTELLN